MEKYVMKGRLLVLGTVLVVGLLGGCAQYENKRGVDVTWQPAAMQDLVVGETTRKQVMTELGPPSQVISLDGETVLYYLYERSEGTGLILIVYNRFSVDTRYDRAVFFFDENDLLTEYASHIYSDDA
jgi:outer membrane protein assembly factor BamE (lipoprotein component of BamABCDE complex)